MIPSTPHRSRSPSPASAELAPGRRALTEAEIRRVDAAAQHALADRLHDTISQAVRAIPLRLDVAAAADLPPEALAIRREIVGIAQAARPVAQAIAVRLRDPGGPTAPAAAERRPSP